MLNCHLWLVVAVLDSMGLKVSAEFTGNISPILPTQGLLVPKNEQVIGKVLPSRKLGFRPRMCRKFPVKRLKMDKGLCTIGGRFQGTQSKDFPPHPHLS